MALALFLSIMEITPASVDQIKQVNGRWIEIESDVGDIAKRLQEIDKRLFLRVSNDQNVFAIFAKENGKEYLVTTATELDARLIERIQKISSPGYNYAAELDKIDRQAKKDAEYAFDQAVGKSAEELAYAMRKELGLTKDKAYFRG